MYGFTPVIQNEDKIRLVPNEGSFWHDKDNRLYLLGATVEHYRGSSNGFRDFDIKREVLEGEIVVR